MAEENTMTGGQPQPLRMVLFCLICRKDPQSGVVRFLLMPKQGYPAFPATKLREGEDLYHALVRPMEEDLGLQPHAYSLEEELEAIPQSKKSPRYTGATRSYYLYPAVISLTKPGMQQLQERPAGEIMWHTAEEILELTQLDANVKVVAEYVLGKRPDLMVDVPDAPTMNALACQWAAANAGGVRVVRQKDVRSILAAGDRAFNLRVADPYLPYQSQGLGFTWSFFTPKDKQDVHVHGLPAVEIYGVIEGRLQIWHKPMNQRGVLTWNYETLGPGDWVEVEALHCHFACWLDREGLGTVVKAAGSGELAGVGMLGVKGKTVCNNECSMKGKCPFPPRMQVLIAEYAKPFPKRDYARIAAAAEGTE